MGRRLEGCPPCLPKGGLGLGILDLARRTSQSSGESHAMNELFLSRSAWLIESHWSSCRLPGNTKSSASRSANHDALSGSKTWAVLAETRSDRQCLIERSGFGSD